MRYTTIGKAFKLKSGVGLSAKKMISGDYPVFGGNGINGTHNEYMFKDQKIAIGRVGAYCGNVHKTEPKSWITDNALFIHEFFEEYDTNYLVMLLRNLNLNKYASQSGQPLISAGRLKDVQIPLPPLDQQKKIASILDAADAYRQKTKALIEKYDELTQSLFLDMFGDPVSNPKGWQEVIFTDVLILRRGFDLPIQDRTKGEYPIMASNGVLDWHNNFRVEGPGVVTGRSGTLGHVHLVESNYWPLNTALYSQDLNGNNPIFLVFLLRNYRVERFSRGAGVPTLNRNLVHAETIMKVPLKLQNQFAERVKAIEEQKAQAEASLALAEDLFNSLLQRAFKGELTS